MLCWTQSRIIGDSSIYPALLFSVGTTICWASRIYTCFHLCVVSSIPYNDTQPPPHTQSPLWPSYPSRRYACTRFYLPPLIFHHVLLASQLLEFAIHELSIRTGETLAELLNTTLVCIKFRVLLSFWSLKPVLVYRVTREYLHNCRPPLCPDRSNTLPRLKHPHRVELIVAVRKSFYS